MAAERLQKLLAQAGYGSRRACEAIIAEGRVTVNGQVAQVGDKADPATDVITIDGQRLKPEAPPVYIILNKPRNIVTTNEDEFGRTTVRELVNYAGQVYPVGRLDADSEGLVLLTNDGALANVLTHPRYQHEKEYLVFVKGRPDEKTLNAWRRGVVLPEDGYRTAPAKVEIVKHESGGALLRVVMHEGRKRQIREVARLLGHPVQYLLRIRIGPIDLGDLKPGKWRFLNAKEIRALREVVDRARVKPAATRPKSRLRSTAKRRT
ncbi:MAG TPA: pseudouridine synthase [Anaerolineae bacterium]|nr:pseudouridine synthase [Anaerolineae bacterium]